MNSNEFALRPPLTIPDPHKMPNFAKVLDIIYSDYRVNAEKLRSITGSSKETLRVTRMGKYSSPNYKLAMALKEIAFCNFTVEQLEECGLL